MNDHSIAKYVIIIIIIIIIIISQNYFTTYGLPQISSSWLQAPWGWRQEIFC
jgi:hypothetical protein